MSKLSIAQLTSVVPSYVQSNNISVDTFTATRDNSVSLLDTLGKIYTSWQNYGDKLALFDGEDLSFGKTLTQRFAEFLGIFFGKGLIDHSKTP